MSRHSAAALRTAVLLGARDEAEDVVQDALVKAYRRLGDYRGEGPFRPWLLAIVANETRNLHRSRGRYQRAVQRADAVPQVGMAEPDLPDEVALAAADRAILVEALRGLPEPDRTVIAYRYLLDRSEAETASLLSWPTGTVKSRTARALAKLRTRLGAAIAVGAAIALVLAVPPARQAMAHVLGRVLDFAGVRVHTGAAPAPTASTTPSPLPSTLVVSLDRARQVALFPIAVPAALGPPEQVVIADPGPDGTPRVVSLFWRAGTLRLDEFDGQVELTFVKTAPDVVWLDLNGAPAMWLNQPHQLEYVDRSGALRSDTIRVAGPTLVWLGGAVTYRLEGAGDQADSIAIATSLVSR